MFWDHADPNVTVSAHLPLCHKSKLAIANVILCFFHRLKVSKMIVVGDVSVGKTSLVHRFCHECFDRDYKATIGVDFEVERFDVLSVPFNLQM